MTEVADIASAISATLDNAGIRSLEYLGDQVNPPVALVAIDDVEFHQAMGNPGTALHVFIVYVIVARSSDRAGYKTLEAFMSNTGEQSLRAVLEADTKLGGVVDSCLVAKANKPASINVGGVSYMSCQLEVQCFAA